MSTPACSPEPHAAAETNLTTFDWTSLRTPPTQTHTPHRKPALAIQIACTSTLRTISARPSNPSGLSTLVAGTRALMTRKWKHFHLYLTHDADYPACEKLWSRTAWRKWDLVECFTRVCEWYAREVVRAEAKGVELVTEGVDGEFGGLLGCLLGLESEGGGVVGIREWERVGTGTTLGTRGLVGVDLEESAEREDVRSGDKDVEDEDVEDEVFDGQEMEDALPEIRVTHALPERQWSVELADRPRRGRIAPLTGVWG